MRRKTPRFGMWQRHPHRAGGYHKRLLLLGLLLPLVASSSTGVDTRPVAAPLPGEMTLTSLLLAYANHPIASGDRTADESSTTATTTTTTPPGYGLATASAMASVSEAMAALANTTTTTAAPPTTTTVIPTTTTLPPFVIGNSGQFALPPGAKLPSDSDCAKRVQKTKEKFGDNTTADKTVPNTKLDFGSSWGSDPRTANYTNRITGNFKGTTDEIMQWAACKWGMDVDAVRAQAIVESNWHQNAVSGMSDDPTKCVGGMTPPACPTAFGIFQIQSDSHPGTYPWSASSTAFNIDYSMAMKRACYDGHIWLGSQTIGDAWGCVGAHNSGRWYDDAAKTYIAKVQAQYTKKPWLHW